MNLQDIQELLGVEIKEFDNLGKYITHNIVSFSKRKHAIIECIAPMNFIGRYTFTLKMYIDNEMHVPHAICDGTYQISAKQVLQCLIEFKDLAL